MLGEQTDEVKEVRARTLELVDSCTRSRRSMPFPGPGSRIGSACTTAAARCAGSSTRFHPS